MFESYSWSTLANVPSDPGLYAWYLATEIRAADLGDRAATERNLQLLGSQLSLPRLGVDARSHLSLRFTGELAHDYVGSTQRSEFTDLVARAVADPARRLQLAELLKLATPALTSPLYVGVATSLRDRLDVHKRTIEKFQEATDGRDGDSPGDEAAYSFAREVVRRGISPRRLRVYVIPVRDSEDRELTREVAEAAETLLNRLFYPTLGRR